MNKKIFNRLLNISINRKKKISNRNKFFRLLTSPQMFLQTVVFKILNKFNFYINLQTKTFWGLNMNVVLPEAISSEITRFGFIEESVASFIINYSKNGDDLIDVGSHFGFFSLLMSEMAGNTGSVHCFEPTPSTYKILIKNVSSKDNIVINNKAVFDKNHEIVLNDYGLASSAFNSINKTRQKQYIHQSIQKKINAKTITLDEYVKEKNIRPALIKIDAESSEFEVLKGMDFILRKLKPLLCIEMGDLGLKGVTPSRDIINLLVDKYGYKAYEIKNSKLYPHSLKEKYRFMNLFFKR